MKSQQSGQVNPGCIGCGLIKTCEISANEVNWARTCKNWIRTGARYPAGSRRWHPPPRTSVGSAGHQRPLGPHPQSPGPVPRVQGAPGCADECGAAWRWQTPGRASDHTGDIHDERAEGVGQLSLSNFSAALTSLSSASSAWLDCFATVPAHQVFLAWPAYSW